MINGTGSSPTPTYDSPIDIHAWFGLSYSNYLVLHRTLMQSMPAEWQERAVALLSELTDAYAAIPQADAYIVEPATECTYDELSPKDRASLGIKVSRNGRVYTDRGGEQHEADDFLLIPTGADPIPHYNRGRTFVAPALTTSDL